MNVSLKQATQSRKSYQLGTFWSEYFSITQVKHCDACQHTKWKFDWLAPTLHPIPVSDTWKKVGIDIIELPLSSQGNRYWVTLTDYLSKWSEAEPFPTKDAINVAEFLYCTFLRHGRPADIITDQGREFCNQVVNRLQELTGFRHNVTSAYHPQANGLDEQFNQTLKAQLQRMVNEHQDDWDTILDEIFFVYTAQVDWIQQVHALHFSHVWSWSMSPYRASY